MVLVSLDSLWSTSLLLLLLILLDLHDVEYLFALFILTNGLYCRLVIIFINWLFLLICHPFSVFFHHFYSQVHFHQVLFIDYKILEQIDYFWTFWTNIPTQSGFWPKQNTNCWALSLTHSCAWLKHSSSWHCLLFTSILSINLHILCEWFSCPSLLAFVVVLLKKRTFVRASDVT